MTQRHIAADFGALALNHPVEGTAHVARVVHVSMDRETIMRLCVTNSTGDRWVSLKPCLTAHGTLQAGDLIHARFTVHSGPGKSRTWATGLRLCERVDDNPDALPESDVLVALGRACRSNRRVLLHGLALVALASEFVREGSFLDPHQVKEQLLASIRALPKSEASLLTRSAVALEL
jgi:hypothetical protein